MFRSLAPRLPALLPLINLSTVAQLPVDYGIFTIMTFAMLTRNFYVLCYYVFSRPAIMLFAYWKTGLEWRCGYVNVWWSYWLLTGHMVAGGAKLLFRLGYMSGSGMCIFLDRLVSILSGRFCLVDCASPATLGYSLVGRGCYLDEVTFVGRACLFSWRD